MDDLLEQNKRLKQAEEDAIAQGLISPDPGTSPLPITRDPFMAPDLMEALKKPELPVAGPVSLKSQPTSLKSFKPKIDKFTPAPDMEIPEAMPAYTEGSEYKDVLSRLEKLKPVDQTEALKEAQNSRNTQTNWLNLAKVGDQLARDYSKIYAKDLGKNEVLDDVQKQIDQGFSDFKEQTQAQADLKKQERAQLLERLDRLKEAYNSGRIARNDFIAEQKMIREQARENKSDEQKFKQDAVQLDVLKSKATDDKIDLKKKLDENDPKSAISQFARMQAKQQIESTRAVNKQLGLAVPDSASIEIPENATASQLKDMGLYQGQGSDALRLMSILQRQQDLSIKGTDAERRAKQFENVQEEQDKKRFDTINKEAKDTEEYKASARTLTAANSLEKLLNDAEKQGGQALAMLGPKLAKGIAGDVGALSEQDVTRYVKNPSLLGGAYDTFLKVLNGQISGESAENIRRMLAIMKQDAMNQQAYAFDRAAKFYTESKKTFNKSGKAVVDEDKAKELLKMQLNQGNVPQAGPSEVRRIDPKTGKTAIFDSNTKKFIRWE